MKTRDPAREGVTLFRELEKNDRLTASAQDRVKELIKHRAELVDNASKEARAYAEKLAKK
jgi:hypothetical protein